MSESNFEYGPTQRSTLSIDLASEMAVDGERQHLGSKSSSGDDNSSDTNVRLDRILNAVESLALTVSDLRASVSDLSTRLTALEMSLSDNDARALTLSSLPAFAEPLLERRNSFDDDADDEDVKNKLQSNRRAKRRERRRRRQFNVHHSQHHHIPQPQPAPSVVAAPGSSIHEPAMSVLSVAPSVAVSATAIRIRDERMLRTAASEGNLRRVKALLTEGVAVDASEWNGETALMRAANFGRVQMCRLLLDRGADVNKQSQLQVGSALGAACRSGHVETVRLLIERGAPINPPRPSTTPFFTPPLMAAAQTGQVETCLLLLRHGAIARCTDAKGQTALHAAYSLVEVTVDDGYRLVSALICYGADPFAPDHFGKTAVWQAQQLLQASDAPQPQMLRAIERGLDMYKRRRMTLITLLDRLGGPKFTEDLIKIVCAFCELDADFETRRSRFGLLQADSCTGTQLHDDDISARVMPPLGDVDLQDDDLDSVL
ncbi:MAG: hypothetical protein MHM6MM_001524 [Cercozoa sp. M6MM]